MNVLFLVTGSSFVVVGDRNISEKIPSITLSLHEEKYLHFHYMDCGETITVSRVTYGKFTVSALEHKQIHTHKHTERAKHKCMTMHTHTHTPSFRTIDSVLNSVFSPQSR